jgi:hypothetical protein
MRFVRYKSGWFGERLRHSLAAKGLTKRYSFADNNNVSPPDDKQPTEDKRLPEEEEPAKKRRGRESRIPTGQRAEAIESSKRVLERISMSRYEKMLERIESGNIGEAGVAINNFVDPKDPTSAARRAQIMDAVYRGVLANVQRGQGLPSDISGRPLTEYLNKAQIDVLKKEDLFAKTGSRISTGERLGAVGREAAFELGAGTAKGVETLASTGLKNLREEWSKPPQESVLDKLARERAESRKLEASSKGVFNPLRIAGLETEANEGKLKESPTHKKERIYPRAIDADMEVESIYSSKNSLASVDLSGYDDGERAFKSGDREGLIKAITNLESEQMKLKDRWSIVQGVRNIVLSPENRNQTIHMEKSDDLLPNYLLGSGGANKLADQTRKVSEVENKIKDRSNLLATRVGLLRAKLQRMNAVVPPDATVPRYVKVVSPSGEMRLLDISSMK